MKLLLALLLSLPAWAAKETPLERGLRIHKELLNSGALVGRVLTYKDKTYDVSSEWQICDAYAGICMKAYEAGMNDPVMLAFFETDDRLDMIPVDYLKYRGDRSQEAVHYYMDHGAGLNDVFKLQDAQGRPLFDAAGQLTKEGDAAYEAAMRGTEGTARKSAPAAPPKRQRCPHAAALRAVRKLKAEKYVEINRQEYDCLHKFFPKYEDEEMNVKLVCDEGRDRYFYAGVDSMDAFVVTTLRNKGKCPSHGTSTFGKP